MPNKDQALREQIVNLLSGGNAHAAFDAATAGLPAELMGAKPENSPHSPWQILEHMRIAQWDILEFSRNPKHVSPDWSEGYWPRSQSPDRPGAWDESVRTFRADLEALKALVSDPSVDLFERIPHGDGQTLLREALLAADHNAYHLGQLVLIRRLLGAWKES